MQNCSNHNFSTPVIVKVEVESDDEAPPSPLFNQRDYHQVLKMIGEKTGEIEEIISRCSREEQIWYTKEVARNIAEVRAEVPWIRHPGAESTTKYKNMVLAQKKKALKVLECRRAEGISTRKNPGRSVKVVNYDESKYADFDEDIQILEDEKTKKSTKKRRSQEMRN